MMKSERDVAEGFVDKVDRGRTARTGRMSSCSTIASSGPRRPAACRRPRGGGGTPYTDRLEMDRDFGQEEMSAAGLTILPRWEFDSFDAAIAFIKSTPGRYVVKPSGRAQNEKVLSFVGQEEDGLDVLTMLEHYKKGWASRSRASSFRSTHRASRSPSGPSSTAGTSCSRFSSTSSTSECSTTTSARRRGRWAPRASGTARSTLFQQTLLRMKDRLARRHYTGYIDINCIANSRGITRWSSPAGSGYPTINLQIEGVLSRWSELLGTMARGQPVTLRAKKGFQICVVIAVAPFPSWIPTRFGSSARMPW